MLQHQELNRNRFWIYVYSLCYLWVAKLPDDSTPIWFPLDRWASCSVIRFQSKERQKNKTKKQQKWSFCVNLNTHWANGVFSVWAFVFTWTGQSEPVQNLGPESERVALRPAPVLGPQRYQRSHLRVTVPIFLLHRCRLCRLCRLTGGYTTGNLGVSRIAAQLVCA